MGRTFIDWYVAFPPQSTDGQYHVVTWANATPAERQAALARLHDFEQCLKRLGQDLSRRSGDHKSRLFARYLTGQNSVQNLPAIHFPTFTSQATSMFILSTAYQ